MDRLDVSADNFATFITGFSDKTVTTINNAVTGLTANTAYKYQVRAVNANGTTVNSNVIDVTTAAAIAAPVASAATSIVATGFTANWAAATGATSYKLDVSADNFATFITGFSDKTVTILNDAVGGLTASTAYKYRVRAVSANGTSANSNVVDVTTTSATAAPPAPVASSASSIAATGFTANWAAVTGATSYKLDVSADNFATFITGFSDKTVTILSDAVGGLTASTAYKYRVRAVSANGTSANSNVVDVTTTSATAVPPAPVASAATSIAATGFTANWAAVTGATSYKLDVSADNFATFITGFSDKTVTLLNDAVGGLTASTAYKYRVRAVSTNGASANSNVIDVTTIAAGVKQDQTITFGVIASKTVGGAPFTIAATASSGLALSYATGLDKITIANGVATIVKAGMESIEASQLGNATFNSAVTVKQTFCINPAKPSITLSGTGTETLTLTSSNSTGNQWFLNGTAITTGTAATLTVSGTAGAGSYTVKTTVDNCASAISDAKVLIVTGDVTKAEAEMNLFPNPVKEKLTLTLNGFEVGKAVEIGMFDLTGRSLSKLTGVGGSDITIDVSGYATGKYLLQASQGKRVEQKQFVKE